MDQDAARIPRAIEGGAELPHVRRRQVHGARDRKVQVVQAQPPGFDGFIEFHRLARSAQVDDRPPARAGKPREVLARGLARRKRITDELFHVTTIRMPLQRDTACRKRPPRSGPPARG
jgi:hypothetical protein